MAEYTVMAFDPAGQNTGVVGITQRADGSIAIMMDVMDCTAGRGLLGMPDYEIPVAAMMAASRYNPIHADLLLVEWPYLARSRPDMADVCRRLTAVAAGILLTNPMRAVPVLAGRFKKAIHLRARDYASRKALVVAYAELVVAAWAPFVPGIVELWSSVPRANRDDVGDALLIATYYFLDCPALKGPAQTLATLMPALVPQIVLGRTGTPLPGATPSSDGTPVPSGLTPEVSAMHLLELARSS